MPSNTIRKRFRLIRPNDKRRIKAFEIFGVHFFIFFGLCRGDTDAAILSVPNKRVFTWFLVEFQRRGDFSISKMQIWCIDLHASFFSKSEAYRSAGTSALKIPEVRGGGIPINLLNAAHIVFFVLLLFLLLPGLTAKLPCCFVNLKLCEAKRGSPFADRLLSQQGALKPTTKQQ